MSGHELRIAPSILSADFAHLAEEVEDVAPIADLLHVDVMDGHYVDNLTLGPAVVRWLRKATDLTFDTHLMITDPRRYAPRFVAAGADSITFHPETDDDPIGLCSLLHEAGSQVGIAIRPSQRAADFADLFPHVELVLCMTVEPGFAGQELIPAGVDNVAATAAAREEAGLGFRIEVDGAIKPETAGRCVAAGADTLVAGSAIFDAPDRRRAAGAILAAARRAQGGAG
ncbi:MAG: ribulose-phosphate 3-epimerase, partial [Nitriliruptorales bacterium]